VKTYDHVDLGTRMNHTRINWLTLTSH